MQAPGHDHANHTFYMLADTPGKGRGAIALRHLKPGMKILVDKPLMIVDAENPSIVDLMTQYRSLSAAHKQVYDQAPVFLRNGNQGLEPPFLQKFSANNFTIDVDGQSKRGCFVHASRFNHSCVPNCHISTTSNGNMQCHVVRDVEGGEELTSCYQEVFLYLPTNLRSLHMTTSGEFFFAQCQCQLCTNPGPDRDESDQRRLRMRELYYTLTGFDIFNGIGAPLSEALQNGVLGREYCRKNKIIEPAEEFVQLAEQEGILASWHLRLTYLWLAEVKAGEMNTDLQSVKKWTMRAQELFINCKGSGRANKDEREFGRRIAGLQHMIRQFEGLGDRR